MEGDIEPTSTAQATLLNIGSNRIISRQLTNKPIFLGQVLKWFNNTSQKVRQELKKIVCAIEGKGDTGPIHITSPVPVKLPPIGADNAFYDYAY